MGPAATDRSPLLGDARPGQVSDRRNGADQAAAVKSDPTPPAPPRTRPKLRRWSQARQAVFSLLFGAYFLVVIFLLTLLVPLRVSALVSPDRKASYLGLVITTGNIVIICTTLFVLFFFGGGEERRVEREGEMKSRACLRADGGGSAAPDR